MDRPTWILYEGLIRRAVREIGRSRRVVFSDVLILKMYFWSVSHDRPLSWACDRNHYHGFFVPRRLPSVSQFCRRVASDLFQAYLQHVQDAQTNHRQLGMLNFLDGKPLSVSNFSRDPEARNGWGVGQLSKGYKLHALVRSDRHIVSWAVLPMNCNEMKVAHVLIDERVRVPCGAVFMADKNYDSHCLHKHVHALGGWLWVKPRGAAKHPTTLKQMGPARRAMLKVWEQMPRQAQALYNQRLHIESTFSNLVSFAGGLGPLPTFVRRLQRVRRWVGAKIILYHLRLQQRKQQIA